MAVGFSRDMWYNYIADRSHPPVASAVVEKPEYDPDHIYAWKPANNYKGWKLIDRGEAGVDAAAIVNQAINEVYNAGGGTVKIASDLDITATIQVKHNVVLEGLSRYYPTLNSKITDGSDVITTDSSGINCSIRNLRIVGNGSEGNGVKLNHATESAIEHVRVEDVGGSGFYFYWSWGSRAYDCYALRCYDGYTFEKRNNAFNLISCVANQSTRYSIYAPRLNDERPGTHMQIIGGYYQNAGTAEFWGQDCRGLGIRGVYFENANIEKFLVFDEDGSAFSHTVEIANCLILGKDKTVNLYGIYIGAGLNFNIHTNRFAQLDTCIYKDPAYGYGYIHIGMNRREGVNNYIGGAIEQIDIQGYTEEAAGTGNPPSYANREIGTIVQNTDDGTVWIKQLDGTYIQIA